MALNPNNYKETDFNCKHCGWKGKGKDAAMGDWFEVGFELDCPNCHERLIALVVFALANGGNEE